MFSLFLRAYRIYDESFFDNEVNFIKSSFFKLGYPLHFIMKVLDGVRRKFFGLVQTSRDRPQPPTIPYRTMISLKKFIKPVVKSQGVPIVNKATNILGADLFSKKCSYTVPTNPQAGVYVISWNISNRYYVGQTG